MTCQPPSPAANVLFLLRSEGFMWRSTHTSEAGHYAIANVPAGTAKLLADETHSDVSVEPGRTTVADIELNTPE